MKKTTLAIASLALLASGAAIAQDFTAGSLLVRARVVHLDSANKDYTGLDLSINNKTLPEVDFTWFFSPNLAAELVLTVPQKQRVYAGATQIGSLKHLPPTLTLQYHFNHASGIKPYVGAGVNYTRFSSVDLLGGAADLKRNSYGMAFQAGVDFPLSKNLYLNVDVKKVYIKTDVISGGNNIGTFKVDPVLVGVGLGWRF
ncbi:MAG: OmpW family outer membrane protein [Hydrogenophaga sp.]|uniref:OmpW/AlkL family protein n=1 Tax=Hydrogenophaga sp. TaxID=1904254 RepID=UPI0027319459|nr:OmpW family outer membrane protein [Hydrogenophaga sp.]MDP2073609.1 OmpW family outer membrane protein [Hydrogenophaga sp.]MDP2985539.1 OmpW family outer membrane protein [Hydrogenophaga sp.]MDP3108765.1 OmpW family outer membrane protein [Hydrogenophaga sp.]MDP3203776.1 OmpW family outer membrane protein [Hydrogenophaga sp.]MDP3351393.1 OmpW family outer membrane protein [Hydrogenophaga sp.]